MLQWFKGLQIYQQVLLVIGICIGLIIVIRIISFIVKIFSKNWEQKKIIVVGETGAGKTSKVVADAIHYHKRMDKYIRQQLAHIYQSYNENGYSQLEMPQSTFVYSDIDITLKMKKGIPVLKSNFYDFTDLSQLVYDPIKAIINTQNKVQIPKLPIGATAIFDEVANKADARNFTSFDDGLSAFLNLHRKAYYTIYFIYPTFGSVDKRIRDSCHEIQYMLSMHNFVLPFTKKILFSWWDYVIYSGPNKVENFEHGIIPYRLVGFFKTLLGLDSDIIRCRKLYFGNIFKRYESRAEISYFMKGTKSYKEKKQKDFVYSSNFVNYYTKSHPAFMPPEKQKMRKSEIRKIMKESKENKKE